MTRLLLALLTTTLTAREGDQPAGSEDIICIPLIGCINV